MRIEQVKPFQVDSVIAMSGAPGVLDMSAAALRTEFDAGRMRPEWSWAALDNDGRIAGRALWWGRDGGAPIALDVLDVAAHVALPDELGRALLGAGHRALSAAGWVMPLSHTVRLPMGWRERPECVEGLHWRTRAAAGAGLTQVNERLQMEWSAADCPSPGGDTADTRLRMRPATDAEFLALFARVARGSLDVMTRREVAATSAEEAAQDSFDFYLSCPGERDWWRVAVDPTGDPVGFAIPSATPYARNVGYLGVLPERRGNGHVDELLAWITEFHRTAGAARITATTDAVNHPMAAAFARAGYRITETRVDLAPAS